MADREHERIINSRQLLDQIADKWTPLILGALCPAPLRFNALRRELGDITQTALTNCLRRLERNGIVARTVINNRPIAVEYGITPLGRTLEPIFSSLDNWAREHFLEVEAARALFNLHGLDAIESLLVSHSRRG